MLFVIFDHHPDYSEKEIDASRGIKKINDYFFRQECRTCTNAAKEVDLLIISNHSTAAWQDDTFAQKD